MENSNQVVKKVFLSFSGSSVVDPSAGTGQPLPAPIRRNEPPVASSSRRKKTKPRKRISVNDPNFKGVISRSIPFEHKGNWELLVSEEYRDNSRVGGDNQGCACGRGCYPRMYLQKDPNARSRKPRSVLAEKHAAFLAFVRRTKFPCSRKVRIFLAEKIDAPRYTVRVVILRNSVKRIYKAKSKGQINQVVQEEPTAGPSGFHGTATSHSSSGARIMISSGSYSPSMGHKKAGANVAVANCEAEPQLSQASFGERITRSKALQRKRTTTVATQTDISHASFGERITRSKALQRNRTATAAAQTDISHASTNERNTRGKALKRKRSSSVTTQTELSRADAGDNSSATDSRKAARTRSMKGRK